MMVTTLIKMGIDRKQDEAAKVFGSMVKISQEQADLRLSLKGFRLVDFFF